MKSVEKEEEVDEKDHYRKSLTDLINDHETENVQKNLFVLNVNVGVSITVEIFLLLFSCHKMKVFCMIDERNVHSLR